MRKKYSWIFIGLLSAFIVLSVAIAANIYTARIIKTTAIFI